MNADFEMELAGGKSYKRPASFAKINRRLAAHLLWLAQSGDALLLDEPPEALLEQEARSRDVELLMTNQVRRHETREFTPWGWTPRVIEVGERLGARVNPVAFDVVRRVNSKLWSHNLEQELGVALPGAWLAATFDELETATARACPGAQDKWVIKSAFGFAARERVLGRGSRIEAAQATWARRRLAQGETLIFQPWLEVVREYGSVINIPAQGEIEFVGISDLQTNGAGVGAGYLLGRAVEPERRAELKRIAAIVGERLRREGYTGAAGIDALEHANGLHPLLEVNARYTMGFVALAVERSRASQTPVFWSLK